MHMHLISAFSGGLASEMEFWKKAKSLAEEAARRTQELTKEAAMRSQDLTAGVEAPKLSDIVSETTKRSREIAAVASKRADQIRIEAVKRVDQIKLLAENGIAQTSTAATLTTSTSHRGNDLEMFGIDEELIDFVKGITVSTFKDFPLQDDSEMCNVPTISNVRQDLTEWQEKHASLVLSNVKEISKLRYQLCPRIMQERKFWRIYFILVNNHIATYEKRYMEDCKHKSNEQEKNDKNKGQEKLSATLKETNEGIKNSTSLNEQDLDVFLLGDLGESDEDPDDGEIDDFVDDLDKDSSDDEKY